MIKSKTKPDPNPNPKPNPKPNPNQIFEIRFFLRHPFENTKTCINLSKDVTDWGGLIIMMDN